MVQANSINKANVLQDIYGDELQEMKWSPDPYRQGVTKDTAGFGGGPNVTNGRIVVVRISQSTGVAHSYARAAANKNPANERRFVVNPKPIYKQYQIQGLTIKQTKGKSGALFSVLEDEQRSAMGELNKQLDREAWGNAGGSLSQIDTTTNLATNQLILRSRRVLYGQNWLGQKLVFALDNGTASSPLGLLGTTPDTPTILTVSAVNEQTNTLTITDVNGAPAVLNSVPGITTSAFVFLDGFYAISCSGKQGWNPVTAPTVGDAFHQVDRSVAVSYLSGWRPVAGAASMEEALIDAMITGEQAESPMGKTYANTFDWGRLLKELGIKNERTAGGKQGTGARELVVYGPRGETAVSGSSLVPQGNAWMGNEGADMQLSEGDCPDILDEDGQGAIRKVQNDDAYQGDLGGYLNFLPNDKKNKMGPGAWVIITWPTVA